MSNSSLIKNLTKTDRKYMEYLYRTKRTHIWYISVKILNDSLSAEDCCQAVLIKLMGKIPLLMSFHSISRENAYITAVTKNEAFQILKNDKKNSGIDFDLQENKLFTYQDDIEQAVLANEQWGEVQEMIATLTPIQREAVYLRFFLKLDYPEIAEIMNTNVNNARARVHSAIAKIREESTKRGDLNG